MSEHMDALCSEVDDALTGILGLELDDDKVLALAEWLDAKLIAYHAEGVRMAEEQRQRRECEAVAAGRFAFLRPVPDVDGVRWVECTVRDADHVLFLAQESR